MVVYRFGNQRGISAAFIPKIGGAIKTHLIQSSPLELWN
jgi:hypothetical protein